MKIDIAAKTFLLGEYCALNGGPSIIFTHAPSFTLTTKASTHALLEGIHPMSPAGRFYHVHKNAFKDLHIRFTDPYHGKGGLGASTAEFLGLYRILKGEGRGPLILEHLLQAYWDYAYNNKGTKPSGADIIAQANGGLCYFYPNNKECVSFPWPFETLSMILIHTQKKLATHTHLETLDLSNSTDKLNHIVLKAQKTLTQQDENAFIDAIQHFGEELKQYGLVAPHTESILKEISVHPDVLAAKGAGAMGADVVIIFTLKQNEQGLLQWLKEKPWPVIATHEDLSPPAHASHFDRAKV